MAPEKANGNQSPSIRSGVNQQQLRRSFVEHVEYTRGKNFDTAGAWDRYTALALTVRDRLAKRWVKTAAHATTSTTRSAPTTSRPSSSSAARSQQPHQPRPLRDLPRGARATLGVDLDAIVERSPTRASATAASAASRRASSSRWPPSACPAGLRHPLRVRHLRAEIRNGYQVERADEWLKFGNPWEIERPE
jgi:starch phosphorylase